MSSQGPYVHGNGTLVHAPSHRLPCRDTARYTGIPTQTQSENGDYDDLRHNLSQYGTERDLQIAHRLPISVNMPSIRGAAGLMNAGAVSDNRHGIRYGPDRRGFREIDLMIFWLGPSNDDVPGLRKAKNDERVRHVLAIPLRSRSAP